ncbi:MAG: ABC transporter substrate-binding protein [Spirochaetales bacterium]|nr:ABC transporter substrate-binding protein [Spirochaetales bacterium]
MYPSRIVCLTEESTELLYLLGEEERIVGISAYTVRPPQAPEEKPVVSAFIHGSIRKILALKPDLVIGFSDIQADLARDLIRAGLEVWITNQRSLQEIFQSMFRLGCLVGQKKRAHQLISEWQEKLERIRSDCGPSRPRVFFQEWDEPIISGIRWVSELIEIAGGDDIFPESRDKAMARDRIRSKEEIIERDPEIILGSWCGKPMDREWVQRTLQYTTAVQKDRIFEVDPSIILQPGPALFQDGVDELTRIIQGRRTN